MQALYNHLPEHASENTTWLGTYTSIRRILEREEGIVAEKMDSEYFPQVRTNKWLKTQIRQLVEGNIVDYAKGAK